MKKLILLFIFINLFSLFSNDMVIKVGYYDNHPKIFSYNGQVIGIFPDILKTIADKEGWKIQYVKGSWSECLSRLENGDISIMPDVAFSERRSKLFNFTDETIFVNWAVVYSRTDVQINSIIDLDGKSVAVMRGSIHTEGQGGIKSLIRQFGLKCELIEVDSYREVLQAIDTKKVETGVVNRLFGTMNESSFSVMPTSVFFNPSHLKFAFNKQFNKLYISTIDKYLKQMKDNPNSEYYQILNKYLQSNTYSENVLSERNILTTKEEEWIKNNRNISVIVNDNWPPLEFVTEESEHAGIIADIFNIINSELDFNFNYIHKNMYSNLNNYPVINDSVVISAVVKQNGYSGKHYMMTDSYFRLPIVLITKKNFRFINNLTGIKDETIACVKGHIIDNFLKKDYPKLKVRYYETPLEAFKAVSSGKADIIFETITVFNYYARKYNIDNLQVTTTTPYNYDFSIAVPKNYGILLSIFNKVVRNISDSEKNLIIDKWINPVYERYIDYVRVFVIISIVVFISLIIIFIIVYWNRRLQKEINEKNSIQKELVKSKVEADKANRAKSEFLTNMSHEIRTPMNAILGFTEILLEKEKDPKLVDFLKTISSSGHGLLEIINNILDLSKIEAGKIEIQLASANIKKIVTEIYHTYKNTVSKKNLEFILDINKDFPEALLVDAVKIRQVIINLLGNAIKFTEKGYVKLKLDFEKKVIKHKEFYQVYISVIDTGIGINKNKQKKLFHKFTQLSENYAVQGTGLGLAISKQLIFLMNGEINVKSDENKGSEFTIFLKDVEIPVFSDEDDEESIEKSDIIFNDSKVLIVDDIDYNRNMIVSMLEDYNLTLLEASNGVECMKKIYDSKPDIILLDMKMPVMSGYKVIEQVIGDESIANIPIIVITASVLQEDEEIVKKNAKDYLRKPVNKKTLLQTLIKYLPHTLTDKQVDDNEGDDVRDLVLNEKEMKFFTENIKKIQELIENMSISDIINFSRELKKLGLEDDNESLLHYAKKLNIAGETFDISGIRKLLDSLYIKISK